MKKIIIINSYFVGFHFFSFLGFFIKNKYITKRKLALGSVIIGFMATLAGCGNHTHKCYSAVETDNQHMTDTLKTR